MRDHHTITWLHIQDFELDAAFELGLQGRLLRLPASLGTPHPARLRSCEHQHRHGAKAGYQGVPASRTPLLPNWVDLKAIQPQRGAARLEPLPP